MEAPLSGPPARSRAPRDGAPPPLPPGAVRGDPGRQLLSFRAPKHHYVDLEKRCRGCGVRFVLAAIEQRRWYEGLCLRLDSGAARCPSCRRAFLRKRGVARALADSSRALSEAPCHAPAVFAYARAAVAHAERHGGAPLAAALGALSALRHHDRSAVETFYWEGRCHEAAGREQRAVAAYARYLAASSPRIGPRRSDAAARLSRLGIGSSPGSRGPSETPGGRAGPPRRR